MRFASLSLLFIVPTLAWSQATTEPAACATCQEGCFTKRLWKAYHDEFFPTKTDSNGDAAKTEPERRALPAPMASPPFPSGEWQGSPLVGVPPDSSQYPLMKALNGTSLGDFMKENRINAYGWANASANLSTSKNSNSPSSYWLVPNSVQLDQLVARVERQVDSVQTDHVDWGFRSTVLYGTDYRYMVAGGWWPGDHQLLINNQLYGIDFTEQYAEVYIPKVAEGLILRAGRWIACPDIETQFAPDNYMATHSILFTFDTYTQTGLLATLMLNKQLSVQVGVNCGNDMAPWYQGATVSGMVGIRWVSADNNDSIYAVLNQINDAQFRYFQLDGQPAGHDNFNYPVVTWQHKFNDCLITKQEAYFMWQNNAVVGGTPSIGPVQSFGGGGGIGATIPGTALAYGTVNYTMLKTSDKSFITIRNEWWKDEDGMRSGFAGNYTSNAVGITYNFNSVLQVRPEIGYYRNWNQGAFDLGTRKDMLMGGIDVTMRF
ncbi:MAG TPA: outer membrane beta-barrel protein [Gemmatales bacterium]|nr:outer membrane beta-barrel protein [Gemmatales bacterium]